MRIKQIVHRLVPAVASAAVLVVLPLGAQAQKPAVVISQSTVFAKLPSGGALAGGAPAGTTMGVNSLGNFIVSTTYGGQIVQYNGVTGAQTVLGTYGNYSSPGPVAVDSANNLYLANTYGNVITKIPFVNGAYPTIANYTSSTPTCTGADTVECNLPQLTTTYIYGITAIAFDPNGNFYFGTTNAGGGTQANSIWECSAACLAMTAPNAVELFQETQPASGAPLLVGSLAIDKLGDVFFTDALVTNANGASTFTSSSLKELPFQSGAATMHATTPTTLYTYPQATPAANDDSLSAVAVDSANTVYFSTQYNGTFALLNNSGAVDTTSLYTVSPQGSKVLTTNGKGRFYGVDYSSTAGGDAGFTVSVGLVSATTSAVGSTSTTAVSVILNNGSSCSSATAPTVTSSTTEFTGAVGACAGNNNTGAPTYATTVSFTPTTPGSRTATLTAMTGAISGTATVTGVATGGTVTTPTFSPAGGTYSGTQSVSLADTTVGATIYYTLDGSTPTTASSVYTGPISVTASETIKALAVYVGSANSAVGMATYVITAAVAPTPTFTPAGGSYTTAQSVTIADTLNGAAIYYTLNGTTPTTSSTLYTGPIAVSATTTINAIATATGYTNSAVATATYTLNVESTWIVNQDGSVTRLNSGGTMLATAAPAASSSSTIGGVAIDQVGDAWAVTNQSNTLTKVSPAGAFLASYTGGGLTNPVAIAIDGLNRTWIANTNNSVSAFTSAGTAISPITGYTGGVMSGPTAIRIDLTGSVWVTNGTNSSVTRIFGGAAPTVDPLVNGVAAGTTGTRP